MLDLNTHIFLLDLDKKISEAEFDAINFFDKRCPYCDNLLFTGHIRNKIHLDHFIPLVKGGQHLPWNVLPVCQKCNSKKNAAKPKDFLSDVIYDKCRNYLKTVEERYVGKMQRDLEKYALIQSLFKEDEVCEQNLVDKAKDAYCIIHEKQYPYLQGNLNSVEANHVIKYFTKGDNLSEKLTATEIVSDLKSMTELDYSIQEVGRVLSRLKFVKKSIR